ncbi:3-oxoacyl-[acyl-carrier-protein] synthase III C-terminal domain-containing protein [Croceibacterium xixiisoli]|nr:3-oxoacyl-[acyl-carrier-protein] synthase III C-terminal domain-containing protein [Croceibacterium xixiisoli]
MEFTLAGWGTYRPRQVLTSTELDARHGQASGWTQAEFGIATRRIAAADETSSMMAATAAADAIAAAGWDPHAIDVIIGGCGVMEQPIPSTAALVQHRLGLGKSGIAAFDVNQTCLSFLVALDMAAMGIALGRWRRVLVFSADIASAGLDPANPKTRSIFGDGAAAVALEAAPSSGRGVRGLHFATHGAGHALAQLRAGGTRLRVEDGYDALLAGSRFEMDAFGIFKAAARCLPATIAAALEQAQLTRDDLDVVICHQASAPGVEHVRRLFAPRMDRVIDIFADHGNQIAASIPTALAHALDSGRIVPGMNVLLLGTAAGISAGAMVLRT